MNKIFHTGVTGMRAYHSKIDSTANNLANINTAGYKPNELRFESLLYTSMDINTEDVMAGNGIKTSSSSLQLTQGSFISTDNPLDLAIKGEGFFAVERSGIREYTRNGSFSVEHAGNRAYIVTNDGGNLLDRRGMPLALGFSGETGQPDYSSLIDMVGIYTFSNPYQLARTASGRFSSNEKSGPAVLSDYQRMGQDEGILQGFLEASSVSLGTEMTELLKAQRAFQISARIVQTADELEQTVNNLR